MTLLGRLQTHGILKSAVQVMGKIHYLNTEGMVTPLQITIGMLVVLTMQNILNGQMVILQTKIEEVIQ